MSPPADDRAPTTFGPRLSLVLPADRPETVRRMRAALAAQTARAALEVIVVRWPGDWAGAPRLEEDGFGAVRHVDVPARTTLPEGRAAGARAATTPLVFIAETHAYPGPDWAAVVLDAAASGRWQVISSSFMNANPVGAVSWAGFILDYAGYGDHLPAGEIAAAPIHKGTFLRDDLLAFGERLPCALSSGDELLGALRARGRRVYFAAGARIAHRNVSRLGLWLRGRYLIGYQIGLNRTQRWSAVRRALYVVLSPAIGVVPLWRIAPVARRLARVQPLPGGVWPVMALGAYARALGEGVAYALGELPALQSRADAYELCESVFGEDPA